MAASVCAVHQLARVSPAGVPNEPRVDVVQARAARHTPAAAAAST